MDPSTTTRLKRLAPVLKTAVRLLVLALVVWGIARTWQNAQAEFKHHQFSLADLHYGWLAASCGFYILGTFPAAWFWRAVLMAMGQTPHRFEALRAYYVGHLGKYVPGKALVVVIRAALVRSGRTDGTVAAVAVFVETLTWMAVGSVLAAAILAISYRQHVVLTLIAVGLALCAGAPTAPPLFRFIIRKLPVVRSHPGIAKAVGGLKLGVMARGWGAMIAGWLCMGLSLWATLKAMPNLHGWPEGLLTTWPLLTACVALATVAGFVSLIPGGLLVRELVVTKLLEPVFGPVAALISAVVLRLVSLVSEVAVSTILYVAVPPTRDPPPIDSADV